jgi:hypothetical protein
MKRHGGHPTLGQALWLAIRNRTTAISFERYRSFVNRVLGAEESSSHAYERLRLATEAFLLTECGVVPGARNDEKRRSFDRESESRRPGDLVQKKLIEYLGSPPPLQLIARVIKEALPALDENPDTCDRVLMSPVNEPCLIELIWSYWLEEGMLVQTMNAVTRRYQNIRAPADRDPLFHLNIDPLRPLNSILWGFIQDEPRRLTVKRRAYEYSHQYGLSLHGKAAADEGATDGHSKFVETFHNLLHLATKFFKEDDDTTVTADGYPLLKTLKEVHVLLTQGAHNQFGDLPWTARAEMLHQEWILARPEIHDFLKSQVTLPYEEAWMPQVDTTKTLQDWSHVSIAHFRDLAVYGEQIVLSVRYGSWTSTDDQDLANNWARYWRPEIQGYVNAYRAANGIDLAA